ncbi:hypothetical protein, partial [Erythrobacter donghaensis]|uniref:hypothetical protein n=1 Tax=Erythrobacter donghaensis TaxID=267135 RepID=UPI000AB27CF3
VRAETLSVYLCPFYVLTPSGARFDGFGAPEHTREGLVWRNASDGSELYRVADLPRNFGLTLTPDRRGAVIFPTRTEGLFMFRPQVAR